MKQRKEIKKKEAGLDPKCIPARLLVMNTFPTFEAAKKKKTNDFYFNFKLFRRNRDCQPSNGKAEDRKTCPADNSQASGYILLLEIYGWTGEGYRDGDGDGATGRIGGKRWKRWKRWKMPVCLAAFNGSFRIDFFLPWHLKKLTLDLSFVVKY